MTATTCCKLGKVHKIDFSAKTLVIGNMYMLNSVGCTCLMTNFDS